MTSSAFEGIKEAKVNGTTLAYREQGEGEPVVFVHGSMSDMRVWEQQLPAIGRSHRAIIYSRRFARPNEDIQDDADDRMMPHVEDLAAFLREIDAAPAHLVGSSWGAFISLLTAVRYPELVRSLVLEEPPVVPLFIADVPPRPLDLLRLMVTRPRTAVALLGFVAGTVTPGQKAFRRGDHEKAMETFGRGVLGKQYFERLTEEQQQRSRENLLTLKAQLLGEGFPPISDGEVRSIAAPVLLMTGQDSPAFLLRLTDRLEELLPVVERVEIPDASHAMHEDNAPAVNEAILGFVARVKTR